MSLPPLYLVSNIVTFPHQQRENRSNLPWEDNQATFILEMYDSFAWTIPIFWNQLKVKFYFSMEENDAKHIFKLDP